MDEGLVGVVGQARLRARAAFVRPWIVQPPPKRSGFVGWCSGFPDLLNNRDGLPHRCS
jgi:hypothetical protein